MINLREKYGRKYKVTLSTDWEGGDKTGHYEIQGKRGYIRPFGDDLELYITSSVISGRLERGNHFIPKNHYDDATAFVFKEDRLAEACKYVKARNRKQYTPEQRLEMASRMRSLHSKAKQNSVPSN